MIKYFKNGDGKFATWVKVVGVTLTLLSAAVAYGKLANTVTTDTKVIGEHTDQINSLDVRVRTNEIADASTHAELTVTLKNVVTELQEIKAELKNGNAVQRRVYYELRKHELATQDSLKKVR
jgi:hypothetical protein